MTNRVLAKLGILGIATIVALSVSTGVAQGATIDLAHPTLAPFNATSVGTDVDRSTVFDALSTFTISSAGIFFDPLAGGATAIAVDIFASNLALGPGAPHGALLGTASTAIVDVGLGFYDVPINFTFIAGQRYDLAFRSLQPGGWGFGVNNMRFYNFDFPGSPSYTVAGLVQVLDGACHPAGPLPSFCGNYGNTVMPNTRFQTGAVVAPEPTALALFGTGLVAGLVRRRLTGKAR